MKPLGGFVATRIRIGQLLVAIIINLKPVLIPFKRRFAYMCETVVTLPSPQGRAGKSC
jgi:hypothetical protein